MSEAPRRRRGGGRAAKRAARQNTITRSTPYIQRKVPVFEILDDAGLSLIEHNAETILSEIGIVFRDDEEALQLWRDAGADVAQERVRFPKGLCRELIMNSAPALFTQHARNPENNVVIGGKNTVMVPAYGPPFVLSLIHI